MGRDDRDGPIRRSISEMNSSIRDMNRSNLQRRSTYPTPMQVISRTSKPDKPKEEKSKQQDIQPRSRFEPVIRQMEKKDIDEVINIFDAVYPELIGSEEDQWQPEHLLVSSEKFPEGHMVAVVDGKVVGFSLSFIINEERLKNDKTEEDTEGDGFLDTHDLENGNVLYVSEVVVRPDLQHQGIGKNLILNQKNVVEKFKLKGAAGASLVPDYHKYHLEHPDCDIHEYVGLKDSGGKPIDRNIKFYESAYSHYGAEGTLTRYVKEGYVADINSEGNGLIYLWEPTKE
ncbi:MAG: GNAT family N-acetyltransferase [Ignavibacteriales bacterium]